MRRAQEPVPKVGELIPANSDIFVDDHLVKGHPELRYVIDHDEFKNAFDAYDRRAARAKWWCQFLVSPPSSPPLWPSTGKWRRWRGRPRVASSSQIFHGPSQRSGSSRWFSSVSALFSGRDG